MARSEVKNKGVIVHMIVGLGDGGAEATLYKVIANDDLHSHVVVSLTTKGKYARHLSLLSVPVYCLGFKRNRLNISGVIRLIKIIHKCDPRIVQSWMYHSDLISSLVKLLRPKTKIVWGIRNTTYSLGDSVSRFFISKICSYLSYVVPDVIVSCGLVPKEDHISFGYNDKIIQVIHNGVDTNRFHCSIKNNPYNYIKNEYFQGADFPIIGMVARYDKQKGYGTLLEALYFINRKGYDFSCVLVGTNVDHRNDELVSMINKYQLKSRVYLLGQRHDVENVYNILDVFVLSSVNGEGFPNVLIEAMACGIPCVATDVGESRYIIDNSGWVVPPGDSRSLSLTLEKAISEVYTPTWLDRKKGCRARIIKNYSLENMSKRFSQLWLDLNATE